MIIHGYSQPLAVIRSADETPDYMSLYFERPRNFMYEPGDWIDIHTYGDQLAGGSVYSLSSSPYEPDLRITFRRGSSPMKKMLAVLQAGEKVMMAEYGNDYGFRMSEHRRSILIAGGVGVAPFRSMLHQMAEQGSNNAVQLIYLNTSEDFLFRQEFDTWKSQLAGLQIHYIATKDLKRKDREKLLRGLLPDDDQQYYVSGPSGMVGSTLDLLEKFGVSRKSVKVDDFGRF